MGVSTGHRHDAAETRSTAELLSQLSNQLSRLVRDEMRLARAELERKGKRVGIGAGLFGAAGVLAFYGGGMLLTGLVLLLATVLAAWVAAIVVGVAVLLIAGVLALAGRHQVSRATPPLPEEAMSNVRQDIEAIRESSRR